MHFDYQRGEYVLSKQLPFWPSRAGLDMNGGVQANDFFMSLTLWQLSSVCFKMRSIKCEVDFSVWLEMKVPQIVYLPETVIKY